MKCIDEIYRPEFNDVVGILQVFTSETSLTMPLSYRSAIYIPTRFKCIPVQPKRHNKLTLMAATDQELNEYIGVKKHAPWE